MKRYILLFIFMVGLLFLSDSFILTQKKPLPTTEVDQVGNTSVIKDKYVSVEDNQPPSIHSVQE